VLQEAPNDLCFRFAHLVHEQVQKGLKRSKTVMSIDGHYVPVYTQPLGIDPAQRHWM
jgi:hypothetical protein